MATPTVSVVGSLTSTVTSTVSVPNTTPCSVGDLLVGFYSAYQSGGSRNISTPSGWTLRQSQSGDTHICALFTKVATSGDVAASNFGFSASASCDVISGAVLAVSGYPPASAIGGSEIDLSLGGTTAIGATTDLSLAIAMYTVSGNTSGAGTFSAYTSTPSLTWTERVDTGSNNGSASLGMSVATAPNTGTSNITSRGATYSISGTASRSIIVIINGIIDVSVTLDTLSLLGSPIAQTVTGGASVSIDTLSMTSTPNAVTAEETAPDWTNTTASADATFVNTPKT